MTVNEKVVFIVEDDISLRQTLVETLTDEGFKVLSAADGQDALDWLSTTPTLPHVIVTDLVMPKVDGWELWRQLRAKTLWRGIPVVILSSASGARPWPEGVLPGQQLRKPPRLADLLNLLNALVARPCD